MTGGPAGQASPRGTAANDLHQIIAGATAGGGAAPLLAMLQPAAAIDAERLLRAKLIAGVVWPSRDQVPATFDPDCAGWLHQPPYDWSLPRRDTDRLILLGPRRRLTWPMLKSAFAAGIRRITYAGPLGWQSRSVLDLISGRLAERAMHEVVRRVPAVEIIAGRRLERRFEALIAESMAAPSATIPVPGRILIANHSLSMGGAERQIVNTLVGLHQLGYSDVGFVCERRHDYTPSDPFGAELERHGIPIEELAIVPPAATHDRLSKLAARLTPALDRIPPHLRDDVLFYADVFLRRNPAVVHAWQDTTSIKAGLAAVITGVPRIVLSSCNVAIVHFQYWMPWMRPAYRALAQHPNVLLVNNSAAGGQDYARWLGLPNERLLVEHNGLAPAAFAPADPASVAAYRRSHGLPPDSPVVGSIFRFYPEKNPLLWLQVAAKILAARPNVRFLLIGDGPLLEAARRDARRLGVAEHVVFAGEEADPRPALAAMNAFLLVSQAEGLPNALIEAQAQGVPVISTGVGGAPEAIDLGRSGLVVDPGDASAAAAAVLRALNDEVWATAARRHARSHAESYFSLRRMLDGALRLYGLTEDDNATTRRRDAVSPRT
jgi:glycosyltransferase involved in cell wall biosynthesis